MLYMCDQLTSVKIAETVLQIGESAFAGCTNMTDINLSAVIKKIGEGAFDGCSNVGQMIFGTSTSIE